MASADTEFDFGASPLPKRDSDPRSRSCAEVVLIPRSSSDEHFFGNIRMAVRTLTRNAGFAVVSVLTLGLALGANAGIFSVIDAAIVKPLPFPDSDRLVYVGASAPGSDLPGEFGPSWEFYVHYSERSELLEDLATYTAFTSTLRTADRVERVPMSRATNSLFSTLGAEPILGRLPVAEDEDRVVVISHALWTTWFGADPEILGRSIYVGSLDGAADRTVIGVMGPEFSFPSPSTNLWIPWSVTSDAFPGPGLFNRQFVIGRMAPGVPIEAVVTELRGLARELPERFADSASYTRTIERHEPVVQPLGEQIFGFLKLPLRVLFGSAALLLLIACATVANLFSVRATARRGELAVRSAIGAGRAHLILLQMAEAVILVGLAGGVAILIATVSVPALLAAAPLPPTALALTSAEVGVRTIAFVIVASGLVAIGCGLGPAIRSSAVDLTRLRQGSRGATPRPGPGQNGLVIGQAALTLILLIASGLLLRSSWELRNVDPGYDIENVLTFQIAPERGELVEGMSYAQFHTGLMGSLRSRACSRWESSRTTR